MKEILIIVIIVCGVLGAIALLTGNVQGVILALPGCFYFGISMLGGNQS